MEQGLFLAKLQAFKQETPVLAVRAEERVIQGAQLLAAQSGSVDVKTEVHELDSGVFNQSNQAIVFE
jgi:hypothetical protein